MTTNPIRKNKNHIKQLMKWLHLWPGIISALILIFVCITGTIFVYSDELIEWSAGDARYVQEVLPNRLPAEKMMEILKETYPDRQSPAYLVVYRDPHRSVRFNTYSREIGLRMVYMDPYTGKILKDDPTVYFFYTVAHLHNSLLLGKTGQWIIDIATLVFLIELITGIYLWWPRKWNKSARKGAFTVKWRAPFKRVNYDFHKVFGFYGILFFVILIFTGLIIAFEPLGNATMRLFGGVDPHHWKPERVFTEEDKSHATFHINDAVDEAFRMYPDKKEAQVATYKMDTPYYTVRVSNRIGLKSAESPENIFFDRITGKVATDIPQTVIKGNQLENTIWVLHTGNWMGPIGKLLTFLAGLIGTLLPISGFLIWWKKKRK